MAEEIQSLPSASFRCSRCCCCCCCCCCRRRCARRDGANRRSRPSRNMQMRTEGRSMARATLNASGRARSGPGTLKDNWSKAPRCCCCCCRCCCCCCCCCCCNSIESWFDAIRSISRPVWMSLPLCLENLWNSTSDRPGAGIFLAEGGCEAKGRYKALSEFQIGPAPGATQ